MKKAQKILCFHIRGEEYKVNEKGEIKTEKLNDFSKDWIFLGGTKHHWTRNFLDVTLKEAFKNPKSLNGCLGWDKDHGTTRCWGGSYLGKLPRIQYAHIIDPKELNKLSII